MNDSILIKNIITLLGLHFHYEYANINTDVVIDLQIYNKKTNKLMNTSFTKKEIANTILINNLNTQHNYILSIVEKYFNTTLKDNTNRNNEIEFYFSIYKQFVDFIYDCLLPDIIHDDIERIVLNSFFTKILLPIESVTYEQLSIYSTHILHKHCKDKNIEYNKHIKINVNKYLETQFIVIENIHTFEDKLNYLSKLNTDILNLLYKLKLN